jgi:hypothetical protein
MVEMKAHLSIPIEAKLSDIYTKNGAKLGDKMQVYGCM